jgi:FKBP-type peptidyl-prolyl cis-trans isomerase 2
LVGMSVGQKRSVSIVKEEAYGDVNPAAIIRVSKETFPNDFPFEKKGTIVPLKNDDGDELFGRLDAVEGDEVVVNLNHPMAGKDLQFEIELIGITKGPEEVAPVTATATETTETKVTKKKTKAKKTKTNKATKTDAE